MIGPILRRARKGNSRRIIMEAHLPHFSHNPRPAPFSATPRNTNQKPARFSSVRVGRNSIRPTDGHTRGRMGKKMDRISSVRVGAYCIRLYKRPRQRPNESNPHPKIHSPNKTRPYSHPVSHSTDKNEPQNTHFLIHSTIVMVVCRAYAIRPYTGTRKNGDFLLHRLKTNRKPDEFSSVRVGAHCICPTNGHARGRMNLIPTQKSIPRPKTNLNPAGFSNPRPKNILNLDA